MQCSWANVVQLAGWEYARPHADQVLAFVYAATVSLQVEESCVCLNPELPLEELRGILIQPPDWLKGRPQWLKTGWPDKNMESRHDLEFYALTAAKARLAGAGIPDGTSAEMIRGVMQLFPDVSAGDLYSYQALTACVMMSTTLGVVWGYSPAREGQSLSIRNEELGGMPA